MNQPILPIHRLTWESLWRQASLQLIAEGQMDYDHAVLDAQLLTAHAVGCTRNTLLLSPKTPASGHEHHATQIYVARRIQGEPLQYILGYWEFWRDTFRVAPGVLIPRPETELLVELGTDVLQRMPVCGDASPRLVLDLATGTGCVGLSLLRENPSIRVVAVDISPIAARLASDNAEMLGLSDRFHVIQGDGLSMLRNNDPPFHLVVSNPPYVTTEEMAQLPPVVRDWEPHTALNGGSDGLNFYREWVPQALSCLKPHGHIVMEFGFGQWPQLKQFLLHHTRSLTMHRDLAGIPRAFDLTASAVNTMDEHNNEAPHR